MGRMYAWADPDFLLDYMSLEEIFTYYLYGTDFEEKKANIFIQQLDKSLQGKEGGKSMKNQKPDKQGFYKHYSDAIERPQERRQGNGD